MNQISFKRLTDADLDRLEKEGGELVVVREGHKPMVVMPQSELEGLKETLYLLSNPANREILLASIADADAGKLTEHELIDP